jgi:uncharacterized protein (DUF433 family)
LYLFPQPSFAHGRPRLTPTRILARTMINPARSKIEKR